MTDLSPPLVPPDTDVTQMPGFILEVDKLLLSNLWLLSSGDAFKAAVGLWCRAWKEVPAGSLPDDDTLLAAYSGAGGNWPNVREMAMRNFIKCSDGRLYHTTLCEDALRASEKQKQFHDRTKAATQARHAKRNDRSGEERHDQRNVERDDKPDDNRETPRNVVPPTPPIAISGDVTRERVREVSDKVLDLIPRGHDTPGLVGGAWAIIEVWLTNGADPERDIYPTVTHLLKTTPNPNSLRYFTSAIGRATKTRQQVGGDFAASAPDFGRKKSPQPAPKGKTMQEALNEIGVQSVLDRTQSHV